VRRPGLLACRMVRQHRLALRNSETQTLAAASAWLHCQQIPGLCKLEALTVQKHNQRHNLAAGSSRVEHRQGVIATSAAPTWKPLNSRFHKLGSSMPTNRSGLPAASAFQTGAATPAALPATAAAAASCVQPHSRCTVVKTAHL